MPGSYPFLRSPIKLLVITFVVVALVVLYCIHALLQRSRSNVL